MNHQWHDAQVGQGSPDAFGAGWKLAHQESSASSGPAPQAEEGHPQFQGQPTFNSLGAGTGAGGNFCDLGQIANGHLGKTLGPEFQGKEVVMEDVSLSGAHPMFDRPVVVKGPYAAVKGKNSTKAFDTIPVEGEEGLRRAEYEDLKIRLETTYRQKIEEAQRMGREVSEHAYAKMQQAYTLLQGRSELDRLQIANESAAMKQCIQDLESRATLKNAVVEYEASAYVEKQKLEAQAREAEQQQEVRTFEQRTMMEAINLARGRDDELRSRFAAEVAENKLRADADARRAIDIEESIDVR